MLPVSRFANNWMPSVFSDLFDNNEQLFRANATAPSINVIENEKDFEVELAAPGLSKDDYKISINADGDLSIHMEKKDCKDEKSKDGKKYLRREFSYEKFEQTLVLPDNVDKKRISAEAKNGVLTVTLPKLDEQEKEVERLIEVK